MICSITIHSEEPRRIFNCVLDSLQIFNEYYIIVDMSFKFVTLSLIVFTILKLQILSNAKNEKFLRYRRIIYVKSVCLIKIYNSNRENQPNIFFLSHIIRILYEIR